MGRRVGVNDMEKRDVSCSRWDLDPGFLISLLSSSCLLLKESDACYVIKTCSFVTCASKHVLVVNRPTENIQKCIRPSWSTGNNGMFS
jgi:hypothetical protein